jgi:hypothetical protein
LTAWRQQVARISSSQARAACIKGVNPLLSERVRIGSGVQQRLAPSSLPTSAGNEPIGTRSPTA